VKTAAAKPIDSMTTVTKSFLFLVLTALIALPALAGSSVNYEYDPYGNCTAITTVAANDTVLEKGTFEYDAYRRCTAFTEAADTPQARAWNWIYDRYFHDWAYGLSAFAHTSRQWRVQIEPPYDSAGHRHITSHWFDNEDRIVEEYTGLISTPNGTQCGAWDGGPDTEVHYFGYDPNGNKASYTDPRGRLTEYEYNLRNLQTRSTEYPLAGESPGDPRVTQTTYDTAGNKTMVTFPDMQTQQWLYYDAFGQPGTFIDERQDHTELTYVWGPMKKLYTVTTHRLRDDGAWEPQLTTFSYDLMGRSTQVLFPDSSHEDTTYECADGVGYRCDQPRTLRTRKGQVKTISYDARGRVINESFSGDSAAPAISKAWDDANRVTSMCNIYSTIDFGYDGGGLTLWEGDSIAGSNGRNQITYHRYGNGKVSDTGYPDNVWVHRDYIGRGQLKTVYDSLSAQPVIDYTYLPDGKVDHADYRNGMRTAYAYDGRGMTSVVDHFRINGSQHLSTREYTRDSRDRIVSFKKGISGYNPMEDGRGDRFRYDVEGQLVEAWYNAADPANSGAGNNRYDGFNYDQLGNRAGSAFVASHGPMTFTRKDNGLNQYSGWWPYCFIKFDDDIGGSWGAPGAANGVQMQDGNTTAGFNSLNQPIMVIRPGMSNWEYFGYDPLGRCVKRWIGGDGSAASNPATYLYYEGWNLIQEGPSYNSASRNYIHGARVDEVVKQITPSNWWERYFQYDARGHCTLQTDASGNINEQYEYDAFGYPYFFDGSGNPIGTYDVHGIFRGYSPWGNRFLFTGREYLSELALYDYRNRMYQPELGRFMQPDPKEFSAGDYNLYRYCHNDPVNKSDAMGLELDVVQSISAGTITVTDKDTGRSFTLQGSSGTNSLADVGKQNVGPIPLGSYSVYEREGGLNGARAWILDRNDRVPGNDEIDGNHPEKGDGRFALRYHVEGGGPNKGSEGCSVCNKSGIDRFGKAADKTSKGPSQHITSPHDHPGDGKPRDDFGVKPRVGIWKVVP